MKPLNVRLYCRESPNSTSKLAKKRDDTRDDTCARQLEDLTALAIKQGWRIMQNGEPYTDRALSGKDRKRPNFLRLMEDIQPGEMLVVRNLNRLGRDFPHMWSIESDLREAEARLYSAEDGGEQRIVIENVADVDAMLMRSLNYWRAARYPFEVNPRTAARMKQHQANGRRMSKECPYGQMVDPSDPTRLVDCPEELRAVEAILNRHRAGYSLRVIAMMLNSDGYKSRGPNGWSHVTIRRIVQAQAKGRTD